MSDCLGSLAAAEVRRTSKHKEALTMKTLFALAAALALTAGAAQAASTTCQQIGAFTYCNTTPDYLPDYSNIPSAFPQYQPPPSHSTTCQRIGAFTYCN